MDSNVFYRLLRKISVHPCTLLGKNYKSVLCKKISKIPYCLGGVRLERGIIEKDIRKTASVLELSRSNDQINLNYDYIFSTYAHSGECIFGFAFLVFFRAKQLHIIKRTI